MSTTADSEAFPSPPPLIPTLPDDIAVNCLARVPMIDHPSLSAVSRPIRSLLSSPLFFSARSLLLSSEPLLHFSLRSHQPTFTSWFALLRHHSSAATLRLPPSPAPSIGAAVAVSGHEIFSLGGSVADSPSPHAWVLDCRSRSWRPAPTMRVGREFAAAGVLAGTIYVLGGCAARARWAEALDPGAERWRAVASPESARGNRWMHASAVAGGRMYAMADRGGLAFDAAAGAWEEVEGELDFGWRGRACVIQDVLYCYDYLGKIRGFDMGSGGGGGGGIWREVKGLGGGVLPKFLCGATMADVGGRLTVLWEEKGNRTVEIWCAEIEVDRTADGDLVGTVRWSRQVLTAPLGSSIVHCVSVSL